MILSDRLIDLGELVREEDPIEMIHFVLDDLRRDS